MPQDPYRSNEPTPRVEDDHPAAKAASIALLAIIVAWFALGDQALSRNDFIVGVFVSAVALLAGWRAGKNR